MLRNVITGPKTVEIYKIGATALNRGSIVSKNYSTEVADAASGTAVDTYLLDYDSVPMGHLSDVEISAYTAEMDTVAANSRAILIKPAVGTHWATDQIDTTGLAEGDYLIAGTATNAGKLVKAATPGQISIYRYVGEYLDGSVTLHRFEVVFPHEIPT